VSPKSDHCPSAREKVRSRIARPAAGPRHNARRLRQIGRSRPPRRTPPLAQQRAPMRSGAFDVPQPGSSDDAINHEHVSTEKPGSTGSVARDGVPSSCRRRRMRLKKRHSRFCRRLAAIHVGYQNSRRDERAEDGRHLRTFVPTARRHRPETGIRRAFRAAREDHGIRPMRLPKKS